MKQKYHIKKRQIFVQLTDGSVIKLSVFSKLLVLKLSIDIKSNVLWKLSLFSTNNKNYKNLFLKRFEM